MTARQRKAAGAVVAVVALIGGWVWARHRPSPALDPALLLPGAGQSAAAGRAARAYVEAHPDDALGLIVLAKVETERMDGPDPPDPASARQTLAQVRRARPDAPRLAALGRFYEGLLCERLMRLDEAEAAWREAFRLDPAHTEPAWRLLQVYTLQGRKREARELLLRVHQVGRNARSRLQALRELVRIEVHQPAAVEVIGKLTPVVVANPKDFQSAIALGRALVREGQPEAGLARLRAGLDTHPDDPEAVDALLNALEDAGRVESVEAVLGAFRPKAGAGAGAETETETEAILARHRGWVDQERGRWKDAARSYRLALKAAPDDPRLRYRLSRALRLGGDAAEAARLERANRDRAAAALALRTLYEGRLNELNDGRLHPDLYQEFADLREAMGRPDEARAWHALTLKARPDDPRSLAALERLKRP